MIFFPLLLPVLFSVLALATNRLAFKMAVPLLSSVIVLLAGLTSVFGRTATLSAGPLLLLVAALVLSACGDIFLSTKGERKDRFVIGIGLYFAAHLGYLGYGVATGSVSWITLVALTAVLLPYYFLVLRPRIREAPLSVAVLLYLLVSCAALAGAVGGEWSGPQRWLFLSAIALIVISDLFISFKEFLDVHITDVLILPTYYLAHLLIAASILVM